VQNKGRAGIGQDAVTEACSPIWRTTRDSICFPFSTTRMYPNLFKGVEFPKSMEKPDYLGSPQVSWTGWLQQAVSQVLMTKYELHVRGEHSAMGFPPWKNIQKARLTQALKNIPACRQAGWWLSAILWTSTWKRILWRVDIRRYSNWSNQRVNVRQLSAVLRESGYGHQSRFNGNCNSVGKGCYQQDLLSVRFYPNPSGIYWIRSLKGRNLKYVRYADGLQHLHQSQKKEARKVGERDLLFLKD